MVLSDIIACQKTRYKLQIILDRGEERLERLVETRLYM